jgi:hypothetical protein
MRDDEADLLISAIRQFRGVVAVTGEQINLQDFVATNRARAELREKIQCFMSDGVGA